MKIKLYKDYWCELCGGYHNFFRCTNCKTEIWEMDNDCPKCKTQHRIIGKYAYRVVTLDFDFDPEYNMIYKCHCGDIKNKDGICNTCEIYITGLV